MAEVLNVFKHPFTLKIFQLFILVYGLDRAILLFQLMKYQQDDRILLLEKVPELCLHIPWPLPLHLRFHEFARRHFIGQLQLAVGMRTPLVKFTCELLC